MRFGAAGPAGGPARFRGSPCAPGPTARAFGVDLGKQESGPAAIARVRREQSRTRVGPAPAKAGPDAGALDRFAAGLLPSQEHGFSRPDACRDSSAGDQGQASRHTTHNVFVLVLFLSRDLLCGVESARLASAKSRFPQGIRRISRTTSRARRSRNAEGHMGAVELDRLVALVFEPARRARSDRARPCATRAPGCGTGGLSVIRGIGGSSTLWPRNQLVEPPDIVLLGIAGEWRAQSHHRAHPVGDGARQLAGEQAAEAPADQQDLLSIDRLRRAAVSGARPCRRERRSSSPFPSREPANPPRPAPGAAPSVVRSWATKPGMTSAGGPSAGPSGRSSRTRATCAAAARPPHRAASRSGGGRSSPSHFMLRETRPPSAPAAPWAASPARPSVWWFSSSGTRMRGEASAVLLSVCANRTFPSAPR